MTHAMQALVYENPFEMNLRELPIPDIQPNEARVRVAYSGICGSELSGFEGKNSLRKPPTVFGHEFSGTIDALGAQAARDFPALQIGQPVTVNPLISCGYCRYCKGGRQQLCPNRKLHSAHLPGSNAEYIVVRADAVYPLPAGMTMTTAALTEPHACAVHAALLASPAPDEVGLVVGAGAIGLFCIQALQDRGMKTIYCAEINPDRLAMAQALGALPAPAEATQYVDVAVEAVGYSAPRQQCLAALRTGGRLIGVGLHEQFTPLDVNDIIRREIFFFGSYGYTHLDFVNALNALAERRAYLDPAWMRIEPLVNGGRCFDELLHGAAVAKIMLQPSQP